jgi:hypothetical protein
MDGVSLLILWREEESRELRSLKLAKLAFLKHSQTLI